MRLLFVGTVTLNNIIPLFRITLKKPRSYRVFLTLDPASDSPSVEGIWPSSCLPSANTQSKLAPMLYNRTVSWTQWIYVQQCMLNLDSQNSCIWSKELRLHEVMGRILILWTPRAHVLSRNWKKAKQGVAHLQGWKTALCRNGTNLNHVLSAFQLWENKLLLFKPLNVQYFLMVTKGKTDGHLGRWCVHMHPPVLCCPTNSELLKITFRELNTAS